MVTTHAATQALAGGVPFALEAAAPPPQAPSCASPTAPDGEPLTASQAADLARALKAIADPVRLRLISMVAACDGGEACVCDLTAPLGLTQPTVSHHLKVLVDAGIFTRDKRGVWAYYALVPGALEDLSALLSSPLMVRQHVS